MAVAAARHPAATPPGRRAARPANGVTPPGSTPQRPLLEVLEELQPPGDPAGYEYMAEIGCGSEGNVLSARQVGQAHAQLAIKVVRLSSPAIRKHVCQELQIGLGVLREEREGDEDVTGLRYLVSFHDWYPGVGGVDREVHMVLERCEFQLDEMLRTVQDARATYERQRRMSASMPVRINPFLHRFAEAEVVCVLLHVLRALAVLNGRRVIHRDVKAENILWQSNRDGHQDFRGFGHGSYKLCDFGVARRFAEGTAMVCAEKVVVGTLWTIAPEVLCMESYGPNCDIWSLGCVLWEMMFLDKPFHSSELLALQTGKVQNPWASLTPGAKVDSARHLRSRCVYDARLVSVVADLCLQRPSRRPDATALLRHPLVHELAELHGYCGPPLPGPDPWDPASPTSTGTPRGSCSPARDCARRFSKGSLRVRATGESPGRSGRRGSGPLSPKGCESPSARGRRGSNPLSPKASSKSASPARSLRGRRSLTGIHVAPPTDTAPSPAASASPKEPLSPTPSPKMNRWKELQITGKLFADALRQYKATGDLPVYRLLDHAEIASTHLVRTGSETSLSRPADSPTGADAQSASPFAQSGVLSPGVPSPGARSEAEWAPSVSPTLSPLLEGPRERSETNASLPDEPRPSSGRPPPPADAPAALEGAAGEFPGPRPPATPPLLRAPAPSIPSPLQQGAMTLARLTKH